MEQVVIGGLRRKFVASARSLGITPHHKDEGEEASDNNALEDVAESAAFVAKDALNNCEADIEEDEESGELTTVSEVDVAEKGFASLMVITACVVSFAHGSNDVSNSVGPFTAVVEIYSTKGIKAGSTAPIWVLVVGGIGIVIGLGTYGHKVMATVGGKIAKLTFSRGFAAQIATALTVLTATQMGVSVSTTHCLIGAITGVAMVEGNDKINVNTIKRIVMSWVITIPAAALFAIFLYQIMVLL